MWMFLSIAGMAFMIWVLSARVDGQPVDGVVIVPFVALWTCAVFGMGLRELFYEPRAISTSDTGICFEARWGAVEVEWERLRAITASSFDWNKERVLWSWDGGKRRTWTYYDNWFPMLKEIQAVAPHVRIEGY